MTYTAQIHISESLKSILLYLLVDFAIAPIKIGGIAITRQPIAATKDRTFAVVAVLLDRTR